MKNFLRTFTHTFICSLSQLLLHSFREPSAGLDTDVEGAVSWRQGKVCPCRTQRRKSSERFIESVSGGGDNQTVRRMSVFQVEINRKGFVVVE